MAATDLQPAAGRLIVAAEAPETPAASPTERSTHWSTLRSLVPDAAALGLLVGCVAIVQWPALTGRGVYARSDTLTFFFPVFAVLHQAVREGSLPLWSPYLFGGYPLFAEGQMGALYPPSLLATLLPTAEAGFMALRVFHGSLALVGMYALLRVMRVGPYGAVVGALAFGLGSFIVAQQHHGSLIAAAAWLPLVLLCVELALRRADWATDALLASAGLLIGVQALASHIQPVLLTGAMVVAYVVARQGYVAMTRMRVSRPRTARLAAAASPLLLGLWALIVVPAIGAGVAAVQLLPLYELSQESWRAQAWAYRDAVEYSFPPFNFVTLIFPYFFRTEDGGYWSLWPSWEVVLYVGVVPVVLATVGLVTARRWLAAFFAAVLLGSCFLGLGGYLPFDLYEHIWQLPLVQLQRAPSRLMLTATFALAVLAALGADWLVRRSDGSDSSQRRGIWLVLGLSLTVMVLLVAHLVVWRAWLQANPRWALDVIISGYLNRFRDVGHTLTTLSVYESLDRALNVANPKIWLPLLLLAGLSLILMVWREQPRARRLWLGAILALVVVDLLVFAADFHPIVAADSLGALDEVGQLLNSKESGGRVLTERGVQAPRPNQLLPHRVSEADGYSPLELGRHRWYADAVSTVPNTLLDIWNVRWVVAPAEIPSLPSYQQVAFHPTRPLLIGGASSPNGRVTFVVPSETATEIRVIAALVDGATIPDGDPIGEWVLTDDRGVRRVVWLRAGQELADWTFAEPWSPSAHRPVHVATTIPIRDNVAGVNVPRALSYAAAKLPGRHVITRAEYSHRHPTGRTILYGVGLFDAETRQLSQFFGQEKLAEVYRDQRVVVYENHQVFPRAWVAPQAVIVSPGEVLARMSFGPFDPHRQVVLEREVPDVAAAGDSRSSRGAADVVLDSGEEIVLRVENSTGGFAVLADAYYPGWRAYVDGEETEVLVANYLSRAVRIGPGDHEIRYVFDPRSFRVGAFISAATLVTALALCGLSLGGRWLGGRSGSAHQVSKVVAPAGLSQTAPY